MPGSYEHIRIEREPLRNDRRTQKNYMPRPKRVDMRAHGQHLYSGLDKAVQLLNQQEKSEYEGYVLKLNYSGNLDFSHLHKHGIEFVSQEDNKVCIVFSDEKGLATFSNHLQCLGIDDNDLTYKQILEALEGIDNWTAEDRKSWAIQHKGLPVHEYFTLDVELWPIRLQRSSERTALCQKFELWMKKSDIEQIDRINRDSLILYRVKVNEIQANKLLNHRDVRTVDLPPLSGINQITLQRDIDKIPDDIPTPADSSAKVCILDSGITTSHPLLRTAIAESKSFIPGQDEFDDVGHGTAVAGIALYGDVEACNAGNFWNPEIFLYNGKILYKDSDGSAIFQEGNIENTLYEAVEYFSNLGCRIFNLSIGNANAPYDNKHVRGMAYVLDTLARQFDILFIVSAGNFMGQDDPPIPVNSWREEYPDYLLDDATIIIDPAPALNILTVGSLARHTATLDAQRYPDEINQLAPAAENQPSPFTRHGPSIKGALKPELVASGGGLASFVRSENDEWRSHTRGLGVLTFHHQPIEKSIFTELSGTSFAAPYITHLAGRLLNIYPKSSSNLLRAMLINHAYLLPEFESTFSSEVADNYRKKNRRDLVREVVGYGSVEEEILFRSSDDSVVLMAEDKIENDSHVFYELPLPDDFLRSKRSTRQIRVTLSYTPAVRTTRMEYRATRIKFNVIKAKSLEDAQRHFSKETQNEADRIGDTQASNRDISSELRSKGTVQHSTWTLKQLSPKQKWFVVVTRQDYEWGKEFSNEQEAYALVVTLTDRENEQAQLYTQIRERVQQQERVRARVS